MSTKNVREARACLTAIGALLAPNAEFTYAPLWPGDLAPVRALLDRAESLVNGKAVAREVKNAGDRTRRAKKKKSTKPRPLSKREKKAVKRVAGTPTAT